MRIIFTILYTFFVVGCGTNDAGNVDTPYCSIGLVYSCTFSDDNYSIGVVFPLEGLDWDGSEKECINNSEYPQESITFENIELVNCRIDGAKLDSVLDSDSETVSCSTDTESIDFNVRLCQGST